MADTSQWTQADYDAYAKRYAPPGSDALAAPTATDPSSSAPAPSGQVDPFAASGGGTFINGGWIPNNNPGALAAARGSSAPAPITNTLAAPTGTPPPITTAAQVTSGTTPVTSGSATPGTPTSVAQSFQQALVNRLNPQAVTTSDPSIAPAVQANQYAEQRGLEQQRNTLAEQAAAHGVNDSGGFQTSLQGLMADSAARQGQYNAGLVNQQSQLNQANEGSAMGLAGGLLSGQQNLSQQQTLADLQAELQREALAQQGQLGQESLGNQMTLGSGQLNLGLLQALLGNQQFGQSLGLQAGEFGAGLDNSTLQALLGMA